MRHAVPGLPGYAQFRAGSDTSGQEKKEAEEVNLLRLNNVTILALQLKSNVLDTYTDKKKSSPETTSFFLLN